MNSATMAELMRWGVSRVKTLTAEEREWFASSAQFVGMHRWEPSDDELMILVISALRVLVGEGNLTRVLSALNSELH